MIRTWLLRGAWLMLGAAIGLAAALLTGTVIGLVATGSAAVPLAWPTVLGGAAGALVVAALLGLLPGVREIQVTAARTLLRVPATLVVPEPMLARHRARTVAWTVFQTAAGLLCGFCVFGLFPGAVLTLVWVSLGRDDLLARAGWPESTRSLVLLGLALLLAAALGVLISGWAAVRLAPLLLGPSATDRLVLAEVRLAQERRHTVLARELHDGIGHALSIISIQAAAAHRTAGRRPEQTSAALEVIEQTARTAQSELDHLLGILRDESDSPAARRPAWSSAADGLDVMIERYRAAGMAVEVHDHHDHVPLVVWTTALDILAESLTNAHRHAQNELVTVVLEQRAETLELHVTNPVPSGRRLTGHPGRGITGMQERAALLDGTVVTGLHPSSTTGEHHWRVVASLPVPASARTGTEPS